MDKFTKAYLAIINQWQEYVDQNGYGHDDQGNTYYVGKGYAGGTYGLHDRYRGYDRPVYRKKYYDDPNAPKCPKCGSPMRLRNGKYGKFYGCSQYPSCTGVRKYNPNQGFDVKKQVQKLFKCQPKNNQIYVFKNQKYSGGNIFHDGGTDRAFCKLVEFSGNKLIFQRLGKQRIQTVFKGNPFFHGITPVQGQQLGRFQVQIKAGEYNKIQFKDGQARFSLDNQYDYVNKELSDQHTNRSQNAKYNGQVVIQQDYIPD